MNVQSHELAEQFDDAMQQQSAASLGMWIFIATEVLFFGALFLVYTVYRVTYPTEMANAARELNMVIGTINTAVLLSSSFFMALAVSFIEAGKAKQANINLIATWLLGALFLVLKAYEYYDDIQRHLLPTKNYHDIASLFYLTYYTVTGIHALHLSIGLIVVTVMIILNFRRQFSQSYSTPIELTGLYWHFVDIIWIFLYPLLYLVGRDS